MNRVIYLFLLCFLAGCGSKQPAKGKQRQRDELVARISSIPDTPFFARVESFDEDPESMYNLIVRYRYSGEFDVVRDFYTQEMERFGWRTVMQVNAGDQVITFEKPDLYAVVEIRPKENRYTITLGCRII